MKIFKILEPVSTMFHGRFQYYYREPFKYMFKDGINPYIAEYEEVEFDLNKLTVKITNGKSPFTGKNQKYYFFKYNNKDIYIEDYDSESETFVEKIVKNLPQENILIEN